MMRKIALVAVVFAALPVASSRAALPTCPDGRDFITTYTNTGAYIRHGQGLDLEMDSSHRSRITGANIRITAAGRSRTIPVTLTGFETHVVTSAPQRGSKVRISFAWEQDLGTQAACNGSDIYDRPLIARKGSVGSPRHSRIAGAFRVRLRPVNFGKPRVRAIWRFTPACDFFACASRLHSSRAVPARFHVIHLGARLRLRRDGTYTARYYAGRHDGCLVSGHKVNLITGATFGYFKHDYRHAFAYTVAIQLRVTRSRDGVALNLGGRILLDINAVGPARAAGCRGPSPERVNVVASKL